MSRLPAGILICLCFCAVPFHIAVGGVASRVNPNIWSGVEWAHPVVRDQLREFNDNTERTPLHVDRWDDEKNFEKFIDGQWGCEILYHRVLPSDDEAVVLKERWPEGEMQPEAFIVGHVRIAVIVHRTNPIRQLALDQVRELLRVEGEGKQWREIGGVPGSGAVIRPYGEGRDATSRLVIRRACMMLGPRNPTGYHNYRDDFEQLADADKVIEKVRTDRNGIGFILYAGQELPPQVRLVPLAKSADDDPVNLKHGQFIQEDYPLSEPLVLYLRPDASKAARAFCHFAIGPQGRVIAASHGLTTMHQHAESVAEERFSEVRAGRGVRVPIIGTKAMKTIVPDLGNEYVRAKEVMQLSYHPSDIDAAAIGAFVSDHTNRPELLFLTGRPSGRAFEMHGERWNELQPTEHLLAGRATAIIVNAANKIDSLTLGQIEAIFAGDVDDWAIVGGSGLAAPPQRQGPNLITINRFGLRRNDPAAIIFHRERAAGKHGRITLLPGTEEVLAAVSIDPQAIGFVDLAELPHTGQTVKVLGIQLDPVKNDEHAQIIRPTPDTIRNAMYPFAERLYLYIHPQASDTAKDFAQFLVTGGALEKTLYNNPVEAMIKTYRKHGLIPLSDTAIQESLQEDS